MQADDIKQLITKGLIEATVTVEGDDGVHFTTRVISPAFQNKTRIERQQMIYATLGNNMADGTIHALSIKTYTPLEWQAYNKES